MKISKKFEIITDELGNGAFVKYAGEATAYADIPFAEIFDYEKILISYRSKPWFGVGKTANKISEIPYEAQWICFKNSDKTYTVLFALAQEPLRASFCGRSDIYGYDNGEYAVYSHISGEYKKLKANDEINVSLKGIEYEIFTVVPVISGKAVIGLTDKYNSGGAVLEIHNHDGNLYIILSGGGNAVVYSEEKPEKVLVNGVEAEYTYKNNVIEIAFESDEEAELSVIY